MQLVHPVLAVDPGNTTGWALFTDANGPAKMGEIPFEKRYLFIEEMSLLDNLHWVVEDYKIRPGSMNKTGWAHEWSAAIPPKLIGAIEYAAFLARHRGHIFVLQQPSIKPVGYAKAGLPYVKGKKGTHTFDAVAHGMYYIHKELMRGKKARPPSSPSST